MIAIRTLTAIVLTCCVMLPILSAEDKGTEKPSTATVAPFIAEFRALKKEYDQKLEANFAKLEVAFSKAAKAGDAPEIKRLRQVLSKESNPINSSYVSKVFDLVKPFVAERAAVEPLVWIVERDSESNVGQATIALLTRHHLVSEELLLLAQRRYASRSRWVGDLLRAQTRSPELKEAIRPKQMLALARWLQTAADGPVADAESDREEAATLFEEINEKYDKQPYGGGVTIGEIARSSLFEIRHLQVGMIAPDIAGEDLEGVAFKLSQYRGKVVMLSYWASWCGPCMAMVPHERQLVEQYRNKPFALIGVNGDSEREPLKEVLQKHSITWRSFWSGEKGPLGSIPRSWNVNAWPTVYVIDHAGVIQAKDILGAELDHKIESLVKKAEAAK